MGKNPVFGCRLVGMIPCSDAFGVDLIIQEYDEMIKREEELQDERNALLESLVAAA